jgi:hypothetical protein
MNVPTTPRATGTTRRRMVALLGGGGAAVAATQLPRASAVAADNDPLVLGTANQASSGTGLSSDAPLTLNLDNNAANGGGLSVNSVGATAISASSQSGIGGTFSSDTGQALIANGPSQFNATGGFAISVDNPDGGGIQLHCGPTEETPTIKANRFSTEPVETGPTIVGVSSLPGSFGDGPNIGILGGSGTGEGVHGHSSSGIGLFGSTDSGVSVQGFTATGVAGWFFTDGGGIALRVGGVAEFDHVGSGAVPAGQNSGFVENLTVSGSSHITVTLVSDPGSRTLRWVERVPGSGFWVHLVGGSPKNRPQIDLTYQIVEPSTG